MSGQIAAISYYLPQAIYSNADFLRDFPETAGTSLEKVGVKERHIIPPGQTATDLAALAAERLFEEHGIDRNSIDFILLAFYGPDYYLPSSSSVLHGKLGLKKSCGALDFNQGCSAYPYALQVAAGLLATSDIENVLVVTASSLSKTFHPKDKSSRYVFGDGAAATLVRKTQEDRLGPFINGTDGTGFEKIIIRDGGERTPLRPDSHKDSKDEFGNVTSAANFDMDGMGVFLFSVRTVPVLVEDLLRKAALTKDDIDLFVFHQPNQFLNETIRKKAGIPEEKFVHCIDRWGNTVQSTIPIALYESMHNGRLRPGMKVLLAGFGVGLSWSGCIARF